MAGSDEGSSRRQRLEETSGKDPHPTALREAAFSHEWEKEWRVEKALFTIESKRGEEGFHEAARLLNMPLVLLPLAALLAREDELLTRSPRVAALTGVGSVAEAAALVGAGPGSLLLGPRITSAHATCAIARNALDESP
ncbi:cobalamin biosynthesis protein [Methylosinus sp. Ce-a6]|uniref:cobalamin biosynthesis protein n=1 Tax=Methylosinus sp. Ce-a6 TaxID=2172005 RepID=UPI001FCEF321|nr:cobalamin biosynthesis protein [Methylosinus sp. Ce-a6]